MARLSASFMMGFSHQPPLKDSPMELRGIAIPFFTESQWIAARSVMEDSATFHDSYADFVQRVQQVEVRLRGQGQATIRVNIDPQVFAQWCREHGRKVNSESRSTYAALVAAKNDGG